MKGKGGNMLWKIRTTRKVRSKKEIYQVIKALATKDAFFILQKLLRRFKKVLNRIMIWSKYKRKRMLLDMK